MGQAFYRLEFVGSFEVPDDMSDEDLQDIIRSTFSRVNLPTTTELLDRLPNFDESFELDEATLEQRD